MLPPPISDDPRDTGIENFRLTCAERKQFFLEEIQRCRHERVDNNHYFFYN